MTGPFGGFGSFVRTDPKVREYDIDLTRQGKPAESFKAVVYRPGHRFVLLRESVAEAHATRTVSINFEPLVASEYAPLQLVVRTNVAQLFVPRAFLQKSITGSVRTDVAMTRVGGET